MTERGAVALVMGALVAVVAVVAVSVTALGSLYAARAQAQAAADASALAAAVATYPPAGNGQPLITAREMARANGAELVSCRCPVNTGMVARVVEVVAAVRADLPVFGETMVGGSSRAEFDPLRWLRP